MKGLLILAAILAALGGLIAGSMTILGAPDGVLHEVAHQAAVSFGVQLIVGGICMALFWGALATIIDRLDGIRAAVRRRITPEEREHQGVPYKVSAQESDGQWRGIYALEADKVDHVLAACCDTSEEAVEKADCGARARIEAQRK
jgi:hypothetical protein